MKLGNMKYFLLFVYILPIFFACGTETGNPPGSIEGTVMMGAVSNATVTFYQLDSNGNQTSTIEEVSTDSSGAFSLSTTSLSGSVLVVVTGGSYEDEATGEEVTIPANYQLRTIIGDGSQYRFVGVNALTTVAAMRALSDNSQSLQAAIEQAHEQVSQMFGIEEVDPVNTDPDILTVSGKQINPAQTTARLGAMLATFSQVALDNSLNTSDLLLLLENISADFADGTFDGAQSGAALPNTLSITPLQAMEALPSASSNFLNGNKNKSGHGSSQFQFNFHAPPT